jgi:acyl-CoA synthetase (AMP-forming)/AMP-acid ligase II
VTARERSTLEAPALLAACRSRLPTYMVPTRIDVREGPLPRNPNGKIDRKRLAQEFESLFESAPR